MCQVSQSTRTELQLSSIKLFAAVTVTEKVCYAGVLQLKLLRFKKEVAGTNVTSILEKPQAVEGKWNFQ